MVLFDTSPTGTVIFDFLWCLFIFCNKVHYFILTQQHLGFGDRIWSLHVLPIECKYTMCNSNPQLLDWGG